MEQEVTWTNLQKKLNRLNERIKELEEAVLFGERDRLDLWTSVQSLSDGLESLEQLKRSARSVVQLASATMLNTKQTKQS